MKPLPQTLLTTSRVRHLEYLFQPPGLPLVEKVPEKPHTTSILVRGRAGTGKSTLAVALALDLAAMQEGRVLYLSTEIAPVDIAFKLRQLRIPPELLSGWDNATADHTVLAQHLGVYEDLEIDRPEARMEKALEKAWELVQSPPPGAALRALVIDAFSLVGATPDPGLRGVLLNLLQQLENLGISTILVEEAPAPTADWTSFLADVVFELSWAEDPDTNKLFRRLGCMKSRFVPSNPGPHDYGMEEEDLAVWPPLWGYSATRAKAHPTTPILLRALSETTASAIQTTEMVASVLDQPGGSPDPVLRCSPWLNVLRVDCGGSTRIREGALVPAHQGPESLGWALLKQVEAGKNLIFLQNLPPLLRRKRFAIALGDVLQALAIAGVPVVVHLRRGEVDTLPFPVDHSYGPNGANPGTTVTVRPRRILRAALHLPEFRSLLTEAQQVMLDAGQYRTLRKNSQTPATTCMAVATGSFLWALNRVQKVILDGRHSPADDLAWVGLHAVMLPRLKVVDTLSGFKDPAVAGWARYFQFVAEFPFALELITRINDLRATGAEDLGKLLVSASAVDIVSVIKPPFPEFIFQNVENSGDVLPPLPATPVLRAHCLLDLAVGEVRLSNAEKARRYLQEAQTLLPTLEPDEPELVEAGLIPPIPD